MTRVDKDMSRDPKSTYYDAGGIETLDVIKAKLTPEQYRGYLLGNAIKYACRLNFKGSAERDAEKLAVYSAELAAIAHKQGSGLMKIQQYELIDLSTADGPNAMVLESEEGTYVMHADHVAEVAALKEENERLKESARLQKLNNENAYQVIDLVQMENRTLKERVAELEEELAASDK